MSSVGVMGDKGKMGSPGYCPKCASFRIFWDPETDHSECLDCDWGKEKISWNGPDGVQGFSDNRTSNSDKREIRIEIHMEYQICEWSIADLIRDIRDVAKEHLVNPDIQVTDEVVNDTPNKMFCPHCDKIISGIIFKET